MTEKLYTPVKHVRYDKTGGVTDPSFHKGICTLIDKFGYSGSSIQELGLLTALIKHNLIDHVEAPLTPAQQALVIDLKVMLGGKEIASGATISAPQIHAAPAGSS
nr:hypothetical protein [uncultured Methanoregula sp.]